MCMLNYREGNYDIRSFFDTTKNGIRLFVILGNVLYALTVKLFLLPADLVTGGTTGIGLAVNHYTGLSISGFVLVFNIIMLLAGFIILGKQFALTTIISTFVYPVTLEIFQRLLEDVVLTENLWLCTLFSGLGNRTFSQNRHPLRSVYRGMDIPPLVLNRFFRIPVSVSLYAFDIIILLAQASYTPIEKFYTVSHCL